MFPNPLIAEGATGATAWLIAAGSHIAFGMGLFYAVKKFFEEVEKSLNETTKLEIAVWVLDLKPTQAFRHWHTTFLSMFNKVFGDKQLSRKCFWRSCLFTFAVTLIVMLGVALFWQGRDLPPSYNLMKPSRFADTFFNLSLNNVMIDYLSLWKTRILLNFGHRTESIFLHALYLLTDFILTLSLVLNAVGLGILSIFPTHILPFDEHHIHRSNEFELLSKLEDPAFLLLAPHIPVVLVFLIPAFIGRLWLIAYVISGLLLNFSKHIDFGFMWFHRHFDIENRPLQCIGVVAGTLTALGYWLLAIVHLLP